MSYHNIFFEQDQAEPLPITFMGRSEILATLKDRPVCDVLVVGGGIHGACMAHIAALNGLRVVLLEQGDYGQATSSNSSKLIHGGLRYLEQFDFAQVFSGIRAREDLFDVAHHLVKPHRFLIPIRKGDWLGHWKFKIGLWLYDFLVREKKHRHHWESNLSNTALKYCEQPLAGAYSYTDGITEDARLVIEHILAARQEGAICLNYAKVVSYSQLASGIMDVGWFDLEKQERKQLRAGIIVNCTGPWVADMGRIKSGPLKQRLKFSRGSHIIFNRPYSGPCLFMPRKEAGRYYFVLPHPAGTLVGTTEYPVEQAELESWPDKSEINELLDLLEHDLPGLQLNRSTAHYCFAGIRALPTKPATAARPSSKISRRHIWHYADGVLSLLGGKYTDARLTVFEALKKIFSLSGVQNPAVPLTGRRLAGTTFLEEVSAEFYSACKAAAIPDQVIQATLARRGALVRYFKFCNQPYRLLGGVVLAGDVELAIRMEQARTLTDIMRRRCGLEYLPGHGQDAIADVCEQLRVQLDRVDLDKQKSDYQLRLDKVKALLLNPTNF